MNARLRTACVLAGVIAGSLGCAGRQQSAVATAPSAPLQAASVAAGVPNLYEAQRQVDEYISSGRYDEDVRKDMSGPI
jgi:hypothetical protein